VTKRIRNIRRYAQQVPEKYAREAINQLEERMLDAISHEHYDAQRDVEVTADAIHAALVRAGLFK
jgi:formiminotetrahydrofolate cyclodeaminase